MTHLMTRLPGPPRHGYIGWLDDADALVAAAADGNVAAQEQLWRANVDCVHRVCASMLGPQDAEDAVAETFLAAFASAASFDASRGSVRAWLLGIAVNQVRRRWRTDRRMAATLERVRRREPRHEADHADAVIERSGSDAIRVALDALSPSDRLVLVTQASGDLTPAELGFALGCAPGAAKVRLHRARRRIADLIQPA
jgi:RNA polymerase sigma factor (sigma-70 family)